MKTCKCQGPCCCRPCICCPPCPPPPSPPTPSPSPPCNPLPYRTFLSVVYDPNGGAGGFTDTNIPIFSLYQIKTPAQAGISRTGYTFTAWNTQPDGSGDAYTPGQRVWLASVLILYAQWAPEPPGSPPPGINAAHGGDAMVSGTGNRGCTVIVTFPYGAQLMAVVKKGGSWSIALPEGLTLMEGQTISAVQICSGMTESPPAVTTVLPHPGYTVSGLVSPVAFDCLGLGPDFLRLFDVIVELRETFRTPAPPALHTVAVPADGVGLGAFTIPNVPEGEYVLYIKRPGYLTRSMNVTVSAAAAAPGTLTVFLTPPGPADHGVFNLWAGDVNNNLFIDNSDFLAIMEAFGASYPNPPYAPNLDLNADGMIDNDDLALATANVNLGATDYPGAEDVDIYV